MIQQSTVTKISQDDDKNTTSLSLKNVHFLYFILIFKLSKTTKYQIFQTKLGEGAFGAVFLAENTKTNE